MFTFAVFLTFLQCLQSLLQVVVRKWQNMETEQFHQNLEQLIFMKILE